MEGNIRLREHRSGGTLGWGNTELGEHQAEGTHRAWGTSGWGNTELGGGGHQTEGTLG